MGLHGISWPWVKYPTWVEDADVVDIAIRDILFTPNGERKMNSSFGSQLLKIVFENKGRVLDALAKREITVALSQHLTVARLLNIDIVYPEDETEPVEVTLYYEYQGVSGATTLEVESQ